MSLTLYPDQPVFDLKKTVQQVVIENTIVVPNIFGANTSFTIVVRGDSVLLTFEIAREMVIPTEKNVNSYSLSRETFDAQLAKSCEKKSDTVRSFLRDLKGKMAFNLIK